MNACWVLNYVVLNFGRYDSWFWVWNSILYVHCWFGKITGIWYSLQCKYCIFLKFSPQKTDQICSFPTKNGKKELRLPTRCKHFRPNHILKPRKPTKARRSVVGFSPEAHPMDPENFSDQIISDHCVVGFRPEAHPMGPEKAFPTDSFPTTMWSFLQLGPAAEPWTSLPTNTFRPSLVGFETIHVYDTSTVGQIYLIQSTCIWTWKHISDRQNRSVL